MNRRFLILMIVCALSSPAWALPACVRWIANVAIVTALMGTPHDGDRTPREPREVTAMKQLVIDSNAAAVVWVTYDNRPDFRASGGEFKKFFIERGVSAKSEFYDAFPNRPGVAPARYFEVPVTAELELGADSFASAVDNALAQIEFASSPRLYLAINAHGQDGFVGGICRQYGDNVDHFALLQMLDRKIATFQKKTGRTPEIVFFVDSCYSGSLVRLTRSLFMANHSGAYANGTGERFRLPISIFTAGHDLEESFGNNLINFLNEEGGKPRRYSFSEAPPRFPIDESKFFAVGRLGFGRESSAPVFWSSHDPNFAGRVNQAALADTDKRFVRELAAPASARLGGTWQIVDSEALIAKLESASDRKDIPEQLVGLVRELAIRFQVRVDEGPRFLSPAQEERAIAIFVKAALPESPGAVGERPTVLAASLDALHRLPHIPIEKLRPLLPKVAAMYVAVASAAEKAPEKKFESGLAAILRSLAPEIPILLSRHPALAKSPEALDKLVSLAEPERVARALKLLKPAQEREFLLDLLQQEASPVALTHLLVVGNGVGTTEAEIRAIANLRTLDRFKLSMRPGAALPVASMFLRLPVGKRQMEFEALFPNEVSVFEAAGLSAKTLRSLLLVEGWTEAENATLKKRVRDADAAIPPAK